MIAVHKTLDQRKEAKRELARKLKESPHEIKLKFINIDNSTSGLDKSYHQMIVVFKNGRMQILPVGINTKSQLRTHLGIRMSKVIYFAILPMPGTKAHFMEINPYFKARTTFDLYSDEQV